MEKTVPFSPPCPFSHPTRHSQTEGRMLPDRTASQHLAIMHTATSLGQSQLKPFLGKKNTIT